MILKKFRNIFNTSALKSYEKFILEHVVAQIDESSNLRMKSQINVINKVVIERHHNMMDVIISGRDDAFRHCVFSNLENRELARVILLKCDSNELIKVDISVCNGKISRLLFNRNPHKFFRGESNLENSIKVVDIKIWFNPMMVQNNEFNEYIIVDNLMGWVRNSYDRNLVNDIKPSLIECNRLSYINSINAKLPDDYLEFIQQSDYAIINDCLIRGFQTIDNILHIVIDESLYYVIADVGIGMIALLDGASETCMCFIDHDCENVTKIDTKSFVCALNYGKLKLYEYDKVPENEQLFI